MLWLPAAPRSLVESSSPWLLHREALLEGSQTRVLSCIVQSERSLLSTQYRYRRISVSAGSDAPYLLLLYLRTSE